MYKLFKLFTGFLLISMLLNSYYTYKLVNFAHEQSNYDELLTAQSQCALEIADEISYQILQDQGKAFT